jgi:ferredoxin
MGMLFKMRAMPGEPAFSIGQPEKPPDRPSPASPQRLAIANLLPEHPFEFPPFQRIAALAAVPGLADRLLGSVGAEELVLVVPRSERGLREALSAAFRLIPRDPEYPVIDDRLARLARVPGQTFQRLDWFELYCMLLGLAGEPLPGLPVSVSFPSEDGYFSGTAGAQSTLEKVLAALPDTPDWCRDGQSLCIDHPFRGSLLPLDRPLGRPGSPSLICPTRGRPEPVPLAERLAFMVHESRYKSFRGYYHSQPTLLGTPCQKCLHCADICPAHIVPFMIASLFEREQIKEAVDFKPADCIECGLCSFVCPSGIPLLHSIRALKKKAGIE